MIISFVVPSHSRPVGGVTVLYEFANGLARRGHVVHLLHVSWFDKHIEGLDDLRWFRFEPTIQHHLCTTLDDPRVPDGDFVTTAGAPARCGLPLVFVQGYRMLPQSDEDAAYHAPCPKICVAPWLVDVGRELGVPAHQLVHVPLGIDHDKYRVHTPPEDRPLRVTMNHRRGFNKGAAFGIAALEETKPRIPDLEAIVFSTRPPDRPLPSWMTFLLSPPQDVIVRDIYNGSRVFICSSLREGFGLPGLEAMACGAALVTTANGGSDDYAVHGETALVTRPTDVGAMADAIEALLVDDERRIALARGGIDAARRFTWQESARRLEAFLERYAENPDHYRNTVEAAT